MKEQAIKALGKLFRLKSRTGPDGSTEMWRDFEGSEWRLMLMVDDLGDDDGKIVVRLSWGVSSIQWSGETTLTLNVGDLGGLD